MNKIIILLCVLKMSSSFAQYEPDTMSHYQQYSDAIHLQQRQGADTLDKVITLLDFKNTDIKDILRGLAKKYDLNLFVDNNINRRVTLRLSNIPVISALKFITDEYGLELIQQGNIYKVLKSEPPQPPPQPLMVDFKEGLLSLDLQAVDIHKAVKIISEKSGKNIIIGQDVSGTITGYLEKADFQNGLETLLESNGFLLRKRGQIFIVRQENVPKANKRTTGKDFWVQVDDSLIALEAINADLNRTINQAAQEMDMDIFTYGSVEGKVNARCKGRTFDELLNFLLKGTNYTYRKENDIYFIGDKKVSGLSSSRLIKLNNIKVDGIIEIIPASLKGKATLKIIKELNAIIVMGSRDVINEIEEYVGKIDHPIPQILIKAIVVDFNMQDDHEFGIKAWNTVDTDTNNYNDTFFPGVDVTLSSNVLNESLSFYAPKMGLKKIGKLPSGFMLQLKALESEGRANIRSVPQIATLNGHSASIEIGTTQYYQLKSERPIVGGNQVFNQVTQRFHTIEAKISLQITPWVSASGEITTEIKPEFSVPRQFDPEIPPTIDFRKMESTVRLKDGETIVLGGLIKTEDSKNLSKVPILGDIPGVGRLFQDRKRTKRKSKLMIYITPHLTYKDELTEYQRIVK